MDTYSLELATGRIIHLRALDQSHVYEGLLEGAPTKKMNQGILGRLLEEARNLKAGEPYLVTPRETPIEMSERLRPYPFGEPAALPPIACVGRFRSFQPARDKNCDASELVVVWLQDSFAFPIAPGVEEHLKALDWERLAHDFEY
ncbi:hypothetical protein HPC49_03045 [Pyxidicoccus fallax]|uniref:Uncharacterized protein n=1 Tax=Pyxidicoccus fallax TaxID=394095 RepID=A0A848LAW8_9BACT|nr:hypothetical protein [Pyxidicoccus fallax]NMO15636.1 hypothetical protein [Pyxidicoccus fallax]NPC77233.1 hypothetical protein [Pyxidicoccus fallax]